MKFTVLFLTLLFTMSLWGQITFTRSNFNEVGDEIKIVNTSGLSVNYYKAASANILWDFSHLPIGDSSVEATNSLSEGGFIINIQFGGFAPEEYRADIIQSYDAIPLDQIRQVLPIDLPIDKINRILKTDEDKIEVVGYSIVAMGQHVGFRSDTIEIAYTFPSDYLDTFHTSGYTHFNLTPMVDFELKQHRKRTSIVDGYGTIKTPHNTYENVIRIHHRTEERNEIKVPLEGNPIWIPIERTIHEYEWWSEDFKRPVFKVEAEGVLGGEMPTRTTFVSDQKNPYSHLWKGLFPNPAVNYAVLNSEEELEKIFVYSFEGKLVLETSLAPEQYHYVFDLVNLAPGGYKIIALTKENKQTFRLIIL